MSPCAVTSLKDLRGGLHRQTQRPDPQQDGAKQIRNYVSFFRRRKAITRSLHDSSSPLGIREPTFSRCPETLGRTAVEINSRRKALRSARWPSGRLRLHACARAAAIGYRRVSPGLPAKLAGTNECAVSRSRSATHAQFRWFSVRYPHVHERQSNMVRRRYSSRRTFRDSLE